MDLGKNIRITRIARGLSSAELARRVGVTANYVSLIENGRRTPSLKRLEAVAATLGVPTSFLLRQPAASAGTAGAAAVVRQQILDLLCTMANDIEAAGEPSSYAQHATNERPEP
jgi:transcriptional regulator with XRE-family HTH domain